MKTTVEISDVLLEEVKKVAAHEGRSVRDLIEEGLRTVVGTRQVRGEFRLRKATYKGRGLRPEVEEGSWDRIRELIYEGRGD
ncbi:MAG TPA: DUF2191 domain-containing protein [Thermoanaerobaculia bacterium]